jgi:peptide/nickel transport system ATP-binding protein
MISVMYKGRIMESAPADKLFENPRHPYTISLLSAIPDPEPGKKKEMKLPEVDIPDSLFPHPGCNFQGRCPIEEHRCREDKIIFEKVGEKHFVRCWKVA